jgi:hypothetical protein
MKRGPNEYCKQKLELTPHAEVKVAARRSGEIFGGV